MQVLSVADLVRAADELGLNPGDPRAPEQPASGLPFADSPRHRTKVLSRPPDIR